MSRRDRAAALPLAGALILLLAVPAARAETQPDDFGDPTADQLDRAVISYDPSRGVREFEPQVNGLQQVTTQDTETIVSLAADILFAPDSWDLAPAARERIADLVADVPDRAEVAVSGHTDSVHGAVNNQELSAHRAQAVAAVIEDARDDLQLEVAGFADTRPAVTEDPDDPATLAANRRVEIVYTG